MSSPRALSGHRLQVVPLWRVSNMGVLNISSLQIPMKTLEYRNYSSHFIGNGTEAQGICLGWENPLEEGKETHSNILAWRIPWTV